MRYFINRDIRNQAKGRGWDLMVGKMDEVDNKGRQKQNGTVIAYHSASDFEFRGSNEVFIDCFFGNLSDEEFARKYYR